MFRRNLLFAFASMALSGLVSSGADAQAASLLAIQQAPDDSYGFPPAFGPFRRQDVRVAGSGSLIARYEARTAFIEIAILANEGGATFPDGAESAAMMEVLRHGHQSLLDSYREQRIQVRVVRERTRFDAGGQGLNWTWLGNTYDVMHPQAGRLERMLLVTGWSNRVVTIRVERLSSDNTANDVARTVNGVSARLASSTSATPQGDRRPAPSPTKSR